jgi:ABC-type branched-subunit amino acid transport system substrate-binding protein
VTHRRERFGIVSRRTILVSGVAALAQLARPPALTACDVPAHCMRVGKLASAATSQGKQFQNGARLAQELINKGHTFSLPVGRSQRGIPTLQGAEVGLVAADSQSDPAKARSETERLIVVEKVAALIVGDTSAATAAARDGAEKHQIPMLAALSRVAPASQTWSFTLPATDRAVVDAATEFLRSIQTDNRIRASKLLIAHDSLEYFGAVAQLYEEGFKRAGITVAASHRIDRKQNLAPEIVHLKSVAADTLLIVGVPARNTEALLQQAASTGYRPRLVLIDTVTGDPEASRLEVLEGAFLIAGFSQDLAGRKPLIEALVREFKKRFDLVFDLPAALGFMAVMATADAAVRARSRDPESLRRALRETKIPSEMLPLPWTELRFDDKTQINVGARPVVVQVVEKKPLVVWPKELASRTPSAK